MNIQFLQNVIARIGWLEICNTLTFFCIEQHLFNDLRLVAQSHSASLFMTDHRISFENVLSSTFQFLGLGTSLFTIKNRHAHDHSVDSGYCMYRQFNIQQFYVLPIRTVFMCFVWIWEQTAIISLYSINWLVCITETECVYCAVRAGSFIVLQSIVSLWKLMLNTPSPPYMRIFQRVLFYE